MGLISNNKITMFDSLKNSINKADEIFMNVSFIRDSGVKLLIKDLEEAKKNGKKIKILTSDYIKITEPNALYRLLDIGGTKIFNNVSNKSFHPKAYIFKKDDEYEVYVGSSNISYSALISGIEWNYHFINNENEEVKEILKEFEELYEKNSFELTLDWLREYEKRYRKNEYGTIFDGSQEKRDSKIEPIKFQIPALYELSKTREEGYKKAMIVVGTGLGKTYLAVFDSMNFKKILFVAHRDEILRGAKNSFENVYKNERTYGYFTGLQKDTEQDIIFASISTLSKSEYLRDEYFSRKNFDYIIIDEFHHSSSKSYLRVLDYFQPDFLLGLTATPDRNDNGDIYKLCDYNIAYECDFRVGINNGWLVPFKYYGIYDDTDYSLIPWRSGKYDIFALENALIVEKRLELVFEKYMNYKKKFTIGFCASVKHCKIMNDYFTKKKVRSEIIIGETPISKRQNIIENFKNGKIDIIFTVDIFNEGVDIPVIDTILFLRPTDSYTIFIQQLGRGLRTCDGKKEVVILDFVGNYKGAELRPLFLTGNYKKNKKVINVTDNDFLLPEGCNAEFSFELIEQFEKFKRKNIRLEELIKEEYKNIMEKLDKVPNIIDIYTFGEIPVHSYIKTFKGWYNFQKEMNVLNEVQKNYSNLGIEFLNFLENTSMTKSYKMPLFLALVEDLSERKSIGEIGKYFRNFYQVKEYKKDLNNKKHIDLENWTDRDFEKLAEDNPIKYLTEKGKNKEFFIYEKPNFILNKELYKELNNYEFMKEVKERIKYRIINYFSRKYMEDKCQ
ncbi:DEAD/DEAH box helicase family protein [Fusobacterium sp.]|uniref:DEAD/DEAH box helicase family protein n=1 Tax=Fusobacterium sp. TaxID=68766 RepID=UPI002637E3C0|nr:DEAD/DEAH box helicase family protein [Fusobacterium sp.]